MNATGVSATGYLGEFVTFLFQITILLAVLIAAIFVLGWLLWWLTRLLPRGPRETLGKLFRHIYYDFFDGAWRLAILGSAAIALTVASAFTTWGGLTSFTEHDSHGESTRVGLWLALAIASGIQTVMLIAAWIIGESFAAATPVRSGSADARRRAIEQWVGTALGALLVVIAFVWLINGLDTSTLSSSQDFWRQLVTLAEIFAFGLAATGIAYCLRTNEFIGPYVQGLGVVAKNIVVWVMFLASLSMSVFFSFDYHFNAIFNKDRRIVAADARAHKSFSAMTTFFAERMPNRRKELQNALLASDAWKRYETQFDRARGIGDRSPELLRARNGANLAVRQQRIEGLKKKQDLLAQEIAPLASYQAEREEAKAKYDEQSKKVAAATTALAAAEAERTEEEWGVQKPGLTGKRGRKAGWARANKKVEERTGALNAALKILEPLKETLNRLNSRPERALESRLIELKSEANLLQETQNNERNSNLMAEATMDPAKVRRAFDAQIDAFRQEPEATSLTGIKENCIALKEIGLKVEDGQALRLDCDPKQLNEALTAFLVEKTRVDEFISQCAKGENLAGKNASEMVRFAETCLQDSGLPISELTAFHEAVRGIKVGRDDRAQSFTVTMHAIEDRNELAGLALAIALIVDSLIFFAGVFAATTVTSPLQRAGLRDLAKQVRQLPAREVRWALAALRNHAFEERQCDDPRINQIITLGLDRQIPTEPPETPLVRRVEHGDFSQYQLHRIYRDELHELVRRAERRGELRPEPAPDRTPQDPPAESPPDEERVVAFAPRPSARRG